MTHSKDGPETKSPSFEPSGETTSLSEYPEERTSGDQDTRERSDPIITLPEIKQEKKEKMLKSVTEEENSSQVQKDEDVLADTLAKLDIAERTESLSESSLDSDGDASGCESDLDSDGLVSDVERRRKNGGDADGLVERGPLRRGTSVYRQGKPYERPSQKSAEGQDGGPVSPISPEEDDLLTSLNDLWMTGPEISTGQKNIPEKEIVKELLENIEDAVVTTSSQNLPGSQPTLYTSSQNTSTDVNQLNLETMIPNITMGHPTSSIQNDNQMTPTTDLNNMAANPPATTISSIISANIPSVVEEKLNEKEPAKKPRRKRTSKSKPLQSDSIATHSSLAIGKQNMSTTTGALATEQNLQEAFEFIKHLNDNNDTLMDDFSASYDVPCTYPDVVPDVVEPGIPIQRSTPGSQTVIYSRTTLLPPKTHCHTPVSSIIAPCGIQTTLIPGPQYQVPMTSAIPPNHQALQSQHRLDGHMPQQTMLHLGQPPVTLDQTIQMQPQVSHYMTPGNVSFNHVREDRELTYPQSLFTPTAPIPNTLALRPLRPNSAQYKLITAGSVGAPSQPYFAFPFQPVQQARPVQQLQTLICQSNTAMSLPLSDQGCRLRPLRPKPI